MRLASCDLSGQVMLQDAGRGQRAHTDSMKQNRAGLGSIWASPPLGGGTLTLTGSTGWGPPGSSVPSDPDAFPARSP